MNGPRGGDGLARSPEACLRDASTRPDAGMSDAPILTPAPGGPAERLAGSMPGQHQAYVIVERCCLPSA